MRSTTVHLSDSASLPLDSAIDDTPVQSAREPLTAQEDADRDEATGAAGVLFPHIDVLACNERFLDIADKEADLHVYRAADAALGHVVPWNTPVTIAASAAAPAAHGQSEGDFSRARTRASPPPLPGRMVHMLLGLRHSNTLASLLIPAHASRPQAMGCGARHAAAHHRRQPGRAMVGVQPQSGG